MQWAEGKQVSRREGDEWKDVRAAMYAWHELSSLIQ